MPPHAPSSRRSFLARTLPLATLAASTHPTTPGCRHARQATTQPSSTIRLGLITDVHHDIMHDAPRRLSSFLDAARLARVNAILQLGDFCQPIDRNRPFLDLWNSFTEPRHHVLGNHDMDGGVTATHAAAWLGMPHRYHAVPLEGLRLLILDGNEPGGSARGYRRFIGPDQADWLRDQLAASREPVLVFVHQALDHPEGIENQADIRRILAAARLPNGSPKVLAVFSGHHHMDWVRILDHIPYLQINSASYQWVGEPYGHDSYPPDIHRTHPWIRFTCPYQDPLWAILRIDPRRRRLTIEGRETVWVGPDPWQLGVPEEKLPRDTTRPAISARSLRIS